MIQAILIIIYIVFSFLVAFAGRNTRVGAFGVFVFSILMTPLIIAILILFFQPSKKVIKKKKKKT